MWVGSLQIYTNKKFAEELEQKINDRTKQPGDHKWIWQN